MRNITKWFVALCNAAVLTAIAAGGAAAKTRAYVEIRGVKLQGTTKKACALDNKTVRAEFIKALKARPGILTSADQRLTPAELKSRKLKGYGTVFRITKCVHELHPPAKGKVYKVLMVEVAAAIDAEKIPSGQLALAGEGSSQVGTEVSRIKPKELLQLQQEALAAATKQAVVRFVSKLGNKRKRSRRRK